MKKANHSGGDKSRNDDSLKGWQEIAGFLGEPVSVVQRWSAEGMPIHREGRFITSSRSDLNTWLGRETGKPVHVSSEDEDLSAELKRGLAFVRKRAVAAEPRSKRSLK